MGKDSGKKSAGKSGQKEKANPASDRRLTKVQDALDTALRREAKAAARLEAARAEVTALRSALARLTPSPAAAVPVAAPSGASVAASASAAGSADLAPESLEPAAGAGTVGDTDRTRRVRRKSRVGDAGP
jgi:hypothetical protein